MINSMTGFARREVNCPQGQLLWEVRSVNHRYLDVQIKLPEGFRELEAELRESAGQKVRRGKLDASLQFIPREDRGGDTELNLDQARAVIRHLQTLAAEMPDSTGVSPMTLLRSPGVLVTRELDTASMLDTARDAFAAALTDLADHRSREGKKIEAMLNQRCVDIEAAVAHVQSRLPTVLTAIRDKYRDRLAALGADPDEDRLEQELAIIAQKLDVSEELDRMRAHVGEVRDTFGHNEPVGRRLDFLMQELNREANTLGSKSADTDTTQQSVELKVLIEQMREQIQNVE